MAGPFDQLHDFGAPVLNVSVAGKITLTDFGCHRCKRDAVAHTFSVKVNIGLLWRRSRDQVDP